MNPIQPLPALPIPPPYTRIPPKPEDILTHPSKDKLWEGVPEAIKETTFAEIDPGVFNAELLNQGLYSIVDPQHPAKDPAYQNGDIVEGTYSGTQAALTHLYGRIERSYESFFDVLQVESTLPRYIDLDQKKKIYQYSSYPLDKTGTKPAPYPPHLETIPESDKVSRLEIFNFLGLAESAILIQKVVPDTFIGKTANWILSTVDQVIGGSPQVGISIKDVEEYNKNHRKSGTDIEMGANIGHLPDWFSDRRFADQSFTGANPTTITRAPKDLIGEFIETAKRDQYEYWANKIPTIDPSSLFVQDCRYFRQAMGAVDNVETLHNKEKASDDSWACCAVTLFELHNNGRLHPIAIVCDYRGTMKDSVTIFNNRRDPSSSSSGEAKDWPWRYAKTCAQVSDWIRHELIVHLTNSHLIEEALIVATNRTIPMTHIVFKVLYPHWYKTLSLNAAARDILVPQIIKDLVGVKPDYLYQFIRSEFENFDYVKNYVPNDLRERGFPNTAQGLNDAKYKNYGYAKNMLSMWYCIRKYVKSMLLTHYDINSADEAVAQDSDIQAWCKEVQTKAFIKSFPTITTFEGLCDAVTMAIHIAAPFHSTVNYLQNFYQAFVIAKPPALCAPLPSSLAELKKYAEKDLVNALPIGRQRQWLLAAQVPWLLSFKVANERSLISFAASQWRTHRYDRTGLGQQVRDTSAQFYDDLRVLKDEFLKTSKGMDQGSIPYMVMDPGNTAVSILI